MSPRVLVVGGGPAGSTAAALLAREGLEVQLLERAHFPRYHVGESISPSCRAIMEFSGVHEKVAARGYTVKRGVLLRWGAEQDWAVNWQEMFGEDIRSWQVDRADFDKVLLDHAAELGAQVRQGAQVRAIRFEGERAVAAEWTSDQDPGRTRTTEFDFLVDASGRAGLLSTRYLHNRHSHEVFRNVAIWAYYQGGSLLPGTPSGGIDVISSPEGWYWVIPLAEGQYSVGFVTHQDRFLQRRPEFASLEEMFHALVDESETVRGLVADGEFQGPVRVEQDFSYAADSFCGPGWFMAGDAGCFLDPLLSTGVHLAMFSGMLSAAAINATVTGSVTEQEARDFHEALYRNAYARLLTLVSGMYQKYQGKQSYFWLAQRLLGNSASRHRPDNAFGAIVAGLSDLHDAETTEVAPMTGLREAADHARERATGGAAASDVTTAPMRMDPNDLYDAASGLHLVTTPALGIRRAALPLATA
ncbi:NAD(P)/FAD-dependent oxidoreductase [Streptacidiphilus rugosus]|uniref:NAD(P)/FAD-dependent oxidoreductase n=1 Tax=Streptacidiphilus rugosus TaxID=405783 RepID=UPI00068A3139|nr:NAD(P)/FAD-dependent oxidoreductase [Streptacidiphilus rugosus]